MQYDVIALCEFSGNIVRPWAEGGAKCLCLDLVNLGQTETFPSGGSIFYRAGDVLRFQLAYQPKAIFAFPPCTHLAVSGAKHFQDKGLKALIEGLTLVEACRELCEKAQIWLLENPVGTLSSYWREPDYYFSPNEYAGYLEGNTSKPLPEETYTKKTCLWTSQSFYMPPKKEIFAYEGSKMHTKFGGGDGQERSIFPMGFSRAVYAMNKHILKT